MYENESDAVRLGVEFLTALTEKDYLTDPSFDPVDLEGKLNEIEADVNFLISNLPVEAIDDDEEREEEYPGDFEDSEELEDEVVECEKLIVRAKELLSAVREHYLPSEETMAAIASNPSPQPEPITPKTAVQETGRKKKDIDWSFLWIIIFLVLVILAGIFA